MLASVIVLDVVLVPAIKLSSPSCNTSKSKLVPAWSMYIALPEFVMFLVVVLKLVCVEVAAEVGVGSVKEYVEAGTIATEPVWSQYSLTEASPPFSYHHIST